jgi:hypothetical protein
LLSTIDGVKTELCVRAVRDHLADCLMTLPCLLNRDDPASIHLYFANLRGMRRELFPRLVAGYDRWLGNGAPRELGELLPGARAHWQRIADAMLAVFDDEPEDLDAAIDELVAGHARY